MALKANSLADHRALLQVLTHVENTSRPPSDIVKIALTGGVVGVFTDELDRCGGVLLPSPLDLQKLSSLIAEGFFAPSLRRTVGDYLPRHTILAESGCFEPFALPVLLFPDCFADAPVPDVTTPSSLNTSLDSSVPSSAPVAAAPTRTDVLQLHALRSQVALLLLKSVNEVLRDAEVGRLKASRHKDASTSEGASASAVMALFHGVKLLVLRCVEAARRAYSAPCSSARAHLDALLDDGDLRRVFEQRVRWPEADAARAFDAALPPLAGGGLPGELHALHAALSADGRRAGGAPKLLCRRPPSGDGSASLLRPPFAPPPLPRLGTQPGEVATLLLGDALLFDAQPATLCLLLRRAERTRLSAAQMREAEGTLEEQSWRELSEVQMQCVRRCASSHAFVLAALERNSALVVRIVQWLRETTSRGDMSNTSTVTPARNATREEEAQAMTEGEVMANEIVERVIHAAPIGTPAAHFIREVGAGGIREVQFHAWVARYLEELDVRLQSAVGQFAAVVAFMLAANRGWDLPETTREAAMALCTQNKQQPDCTLLLSVLRHHAT